MAGSSNTSWWLVNSGIPPTVVSAGAKMINLFQHAPLNTLLVGKLGRLADMLDGRAAG